MEPPAPPTETGSRRSKAQSFSFPLQLFRPLARSDHRCVEANQLQRQRVGNIHQFARCVDLPLRVGPLVFQYDQCHGIAVSAPFTKAAGRKTARASRSSAQMVTMFFTKSSSFSKATSTDATSRS